MSFAAKYRERIGANPTPPAPRAEDGSTIPERSVLNSNQLGRQLSHITEEQRAREEAEQKLAEIQTQNDSQAKKCDMARTGWQIRRNRCYGSAASKFALTAGAVFVIGYILSTTRGGPNERNNPNG